MQMARWATAEAAFKHGEPWWWPSCTVFVGGNRVTINPNLPGAEQAFNESELDNRLFKQEPILIFLGYSLLIPLVEAFSAIELLIKSDYSPPATAVECFNYLTRYDLESDSQEGDQRKTIFTWVEEFHYVQGQAELQPLFNAWDENTRKFDQATEIALERATVVFEATVASHKRLPDHIVDGIYVRIEILQR